MLGASELPFLNKLGSVSAADATLPKNAVQMRPEIEPIVRLLENTQQSRVLEEIADRIKKGLSYRDILAALLLAGVRNIQPRPVGFKFHAVLAINSAHLASMAAPDSDRWLPIFWGIDYFKSSQARDVREGDWTMSRVQEAKVPAPHKARDAFIEAMQNWDVEAADIACAGFARGAGAQEIFEVFSRLGARDFRDIGHKAIYVSNAHRTLNAIGWQHAEPVLRSLAYALLAHGGGNPAKRDDAADRPWRRNLQLAPTLRQDWLAGKTDLEATKAMLQALRSANAEDACQSAVRLINRGVAPQSIWDAIFEAAGELLMRRPGIIALHAVTSANALHFAFQTSGDDNTRRMLLLQNVAFITLFRGRANPKGPLRIDKLEAVEPESIEDVFAEISRNRTKAAQKVLGYLQGGQSAQELIHNARRYLFLRGRDSHDYKFSSAVLEDYYNVSPKLRDRCLATAVFNLRGSGGKDTNLVQRTLEALAP
ncbi:MAG: hypothetical protein ACPGVU_08225 [Limisphaerales bacterium]